ncbi:hypothetical protein [Desulfosporosinus metallidurans]
MGKSMGTVLREVAALFPELNFQTVYVEIQVEEANHYRIKTNPTTLFVDESGIELYRLEGFHETNLVKDTINKINQKKIELPTGVKEHPLAKRLHLSSEYYDKALKQNIEYKVSGIYPGYYVWCRSYFRTVGNRRRCF